MKRKLFKSLAFTGVVMGMALTASAEEHLRVNVPFSFVLAGKQFAAGQYTVNENNNGVVIVQGAGQAAAVVTTPAEYPKSGSPTGLRFTSANNREYYLVAVQVEGETSRAIPASSYQLHKLTIASR